MLEKIMKFFKKDEDNFEESLEAERQAKFEHHISDLIDKNVKKHTSSIDFSKDPDLVYCIGYTSVDYIGQGLSSYDLKITDAIDDFCFYRSDFLDKFIDAFNKIRNEYEYCEVVSNMHKFTDSGIDKVIVILAWNRKNEEKQND